MAPVLGHARARRRDLGTREEVGEYRAAVQRLATAFAAAEAEAQRRGWADFDEPERGRLRRAQKLLSVAEDGAASAAERQQAVVRARAELDGLIVLPRRTVAAIERRAAGELSA